MDLFGMGPVEALVILTLALIVVGPRKLPELGRQVGRAIYQFRKATEELSAEFRREFSDVEETAREMRGAVPSIAPLQDLRSTIGEAVASLTAAPPASPAGPMPAGDATGLQLAGPDGIAAAGATTPQPAPAAPVGPLELSPPKRRRRDVLAAARQEAVTSAAVVPTGNGAAPPNGLEPHLAIGDGTATAPTVAAATASGTEPAGTP